MSHNLFCNSLEQKIDHPLYNSHQIEVSFKRDDMIHPYISGNKWRKLKYNLEELKKQKKTRLVTFGGAWSNHLLATACAGATFGYKTKAYVRGERVTNPLMQMCQLFGMELEFVSRDAYKDKQLLFKNKELEHDFFIDEGGAGHEAMLGCEEIVDELGAKYDHIFCAAGTGTTVSGLASALQKNKIKTTLHVIPVLKGGEFILENMHALGAPLDQVALHSNYHFGGYAKTKPELISFIKEFIALTGIMIEPIYTGKALFALHDLMSQNHFKQKERILFIHTGGLTGLLGTLDKF